MSIKHGSIVARLGQRTAIEPIGEVALEKCILNQSERGAAFVGTNLHTAFLDTWIAVYVGGSKPSGVGLACIEADAARMQTPVVVAVIGTGTLGVVFEADETTWFSPVVLDGDVVVVQSVDAAANSAMFKIARSGVLVGQAVSHIAPDDAVVIFVVLVLMIVAADTIRGEVHHEVAVVGGEFASGVYATGVFGRVVVDNAILIHRLGIIVKVNAASLGGGYVVVDEAVGKAGTNAVANAATHRSGVVPNATVVQVDTGVASSGINVNATTKHGSMVVLESAV